MKKKYPRNMLGYGSNLPDVKWPNNSKIAVQFVLNYEEGGENSILNGDKYLPVISLMDIDGIWGEYLPYSPTASISQNTWRVADPANLDWKPGDTFQLTASLPVNPVTRKSYNLSITTPDLFTDEYRFDTRP